MKNMRSNQLESIYSLLHTFGFLGLFAEGALLRGTSLNRVPVNVGA
jgi:hypothetical protein